MERSSPGPFLDLMLGHSMEKRCRQGVLSVSQHFPRLELHLLVVRSPPRCRDTFEKGRHSGAGKTPNCLDSSRGHPVSSVHTCQASYALSCSRPCLDRTPPACPALPCLPGLSTPPSHEGRLIFASALPSSCPLAGHVIAPDCTICGPAHK